MLVKDRYKNIILIELLLFIGWCIVALVYADYDRAGFYFWGGFSFGFISFIVAGVSLLLIKKTNSRNATEITYIPVYYTAVYLLVSIIINTYFVFRVSGKSNLVLVVLNLLVLISFIAIRNYADDYLDRIEKQSNSSIEKLSPFTTISAHLSTILSITTDDDLKKQLLKLKEIVDYSSNVSQGFLENSQNNFLSQLNRIEGLIIEHQDKEEIGKLIQEATITWNTRNSIASTIK